VIHGWNAVAAGHVSSAETTLVGAEGVLDVDVTAFAGDVVIRADPKAATATIDAVRRGTHGHSRRGESQDSLEQIAVSYGVEERDSGRTIVVRATTTAAEPWFQMVDIEVTLPQLGTAIVRTARGHVFVTDFTEGVDIETTKGDVRAVSNHVLSQPSTILDAEGSIDWRAPPGSSARIDAEAVNGSVRIKARESRWLGIDPRNDHDSMHGTINDGTNLIVLRTVDGDIRVFVGRNPSQTGSFID